MLQIIPNIKFFVKNFLLQIILEYRMLSGAMTVTFEIDISDCFNPLGELDIHLLSFDILYNTLLPFLVIDLDRRVSVNNFLNSGPPGGDNVMSSCEFAKLILCEWENKFNIFKNMVN